MRILLSVLLLVASVVWAGDAPKTEAAKAPPAPPPPIEIRADAPVIARIDPSTLKVTYTKGAKVGVEDVKTFADQMVKAWATGMMQIQQCQNQLTALQPKEKK